MRRALGLANPLPRALAHYQRELSEVLSAVGSDVEIIPTASAEVAGSAVRRVWVAVRIVASRRLRPPRGTVVVLWPVFGLADPLTWPRPSRRRRTCLVVHDPQPLRRQIGMGPIANRFGSAVASRRRVSIVVHGESARSALRLLGWAEPLVLPHPMLAPATGPDRNRSGLLVLGQWKPARAIQPMTALSLDPRWDDNRRVRGRGWPQVAGWEVDARFLSESEVTAALSSAECLVLPYSHYFQSGIAVRALECLTPVAGKRHPFLEGLYGPDWPGLVEDDGDWANAVGRALLVSREDVEARRREAWERCIAGWGAWSASLGNSSRV